MQLAVVDASVALKWLIKNEEYSSQAKYLLKLIGEDKIQVVVPELILYELSNAIWVSCKSNKISRRLARILVKKILDLNFILVDFSQVLDSAFDIATKYGLTVYDASYLAVAKHQNIPFYTADQRLLDKLPASFKKVQSIADIKLE